MNHVLEEGLKTAGSAFPSPSKSDGIGTSPLAPNGKARNVKSSLRRMNQLPLEGRKTAMSVFPSPVKSAGAEISESNPKTVENTFESELLDTHHSVTPLLGRVI